METIYLKKQPDPDKENRFLYTCPAVGLRAKDALRLIPHPYGNETMTFDALELAIEQIHRAGYSAEFEGKHYPLPMRENASKVPVSSAPIRLTGSTKTMADAIPLIQAQLKDTVPTVVASAAFALGEMQSEKSIPALVGVFSHEDANARKNAAEALAKMGKPALKALQQALTDKHWLVRHSALTAISELSHFGAESLPDILPYALPLLKDESWLVRSMAAQVFGESAKVLHTLKPPEVK